VLQISNLGSSERTTVIGLEIGDVIQITRSFDVGTPSSVTSLYGIDSIKHQITPSTHTLTLGLYNTEILYELILDDVTFGVLDSSNALA
jgi:hypothetical protein